MRKVKLMLTREYYFESADEYMKTLAGAVTDWEEISDTEFEFLMKNWHTIRRDVLEEYYKTKPYSGQSWDIFLLTPDVVSIEQRLFNLKEKLREQQEREAKKKAEAENKKVAAALKKAAKDAETKRKLFEELKKEFEPEKGNLDFDDPNEQIGQYRG